MGQNRDIGSAGRTYPIEGHPWRAAKLIDSHGIVCRILQSRKCPCAARTGGGPNQFCPQCKGEGFFYRFQRKLLVVDETSEVDGNNPLHVLPRRYPVMEVVYVKRLMHEQQGGNYLYTVQELQQDKIILAQPPTGIRQPRYYEKRFVSYYFDRYNLVTEDTLTVESNTTLAATGTLWVDDKSGDRPITNTGNVDQVHGDIVIVEKLWNSVTGYEYAKDQYTFSKNQIYLKSTAPAAVAGQMKATYYYAPLERTLPADLNTREDYETWMTKLRNGVTNMAFHPWWDFSQGDFVTLMTTNFSRDDVILRSNDSLDRITEFDVSGIDEEIFDEKGKTYRKGEDFELQSYHNLVWTGNRPEAGVAYTTRIQYHPTYTVFQPQPTHNSMENKKWPQTTLMQLYNRTNTNTEKVVREAFRLPELNL